MKTDLHIHTTASDGKLSPSELVRRAAKLGLKVIAITDHDSVEGIDEALVESRNFPDLMVIPGVELSANTSHGDIHILGYFMDHHFPELCEELKILRNARITRGQNMVEKLNRLGIDIKWSQVLDFSGGNSVGRPHIARAMLKQGQISSFHEAFEKYLSRGKPAYVKREKSCLPESIDLIVRAGGLPVLAHPTEIENIENLIPIFKKAGIIGLEVYYKNYRYQTIKKLERLAQKYSLIACGGSDYHGHNDTGNEIGKVKIPRAAVDQLLDLAKLQSSKCLANIAV